MNNWKIYKKCDDFRVAAPRSVSDLVEIKSIAENGIFEVGKGGIFTKTYTFTDINYATASVDEQISMLESWCRWLNSNSAPFKITWNNKNKNEKTLREEVFFPLQQDRYDKYRGAFNGELEDRIMNGRKGIEQQMYLTIRYDKSTQYEDARVYFDTIENNMVRNFAEIGSELRPLNATDRLRILHDFYRFGDEEVFNFNFRLAVNSGWDFLDSIVNTRLDFKRSDDYFMTDDKYVTCLYLKDYQTSSLSDRFLTRLMGLNIKMMGSVDAVPIPDSAVNDLLKAKYIGIENRIRKQNKSRVKEMDFNSDISLPVQMERDKVKKLIKEKNDEDQHFLYSMLNIFVIADTLEELKRDVALLIETAKDNSVVLAISYTMQREALNTILPIGVRQVENGRNMQTKGLAALFPFNVQELQNPHGIWYGSNVVSKNLVMANRKKLVNPHGFIFGVTGSGKTTTCQIEMSQVFLNTNDDIIVIDPKNDYEQLAKCYDGTYINISPQLGNRYNPYEFQGDIQDRNIVADKTDITLAIAETCKRDPLTPKETNTLDRALKFAFTGAELQGRHACLTDIYNALSKIDSVEARDIMEYLEMFVNGSFNIFAKQSNVNINDTRLLLFGLKDMGDKLRDLTMLIMLECVKERIMSNARKGKCTWLYIDEFHELLHTEYQQMFLKKLWMLVRSLGGICTGLSQNVADLCLNDVTKAMIENSEFLIIMKQKTGAVDVIRDQLDLSDEMIKYVTRESRSGRGLIRSGCITVPFDLTVEDKSELFNLGVIKHDFHTINAGR